MKLLSLVCLIFVLASCSSGVGVGATGGNSGMAIGVGSGISF
ncbi:hypothetical protein RHD99_14825 [Buttiauxella selenatireducens]|uniref:Lipoprotein n=1 Tax=Buttiauxella selenatireducens TaxID=3073902 RepID=A0ABY9S5X7_9ENTR|nr:MULTISPECIES: hypothetical protein [unclassified Buttiauxella]WMY72744.1 hypothetical protein RHD99_14825 [Buttiauxella sp. R73]